MTHLEKIRNILGGTAILLLATSFTTAYSASINSSEMHAIDYWLIWVSGITLIGGIAATMLTYAAHFEIGQD